MIPNEAVPEFLYTVTALRRSWGRIHKEAIVRYVRGLAAAFRFVRDPAHRNAVVKTIVETTGSPKQLRSERLRFISNPSERFCRSRERLTSEEWPR